ncbi:TPA: hypothetical protein ACOECC_002739 [Enterobacter bugandensis]|uniref:hypothetical protein n=1 Tax=Enterobacter TaxID=547 RepID=UPI00079A03F9|nr:MULTISPECIES: hypothetical protein [Enterobacter]QPX98388.1 hypothetical protein H2Z33_03365 [Enterobacter sp. YSU]SAI40228.1 Uncharacterised protein [Enterobacter hormaechei]
MSTITKEFTKEQLQQIIETDHVQCGEASALARIALASLEVEPVAYMYKDNLHADARFSLHTRFGNWSQEDINEYEITEIPLYTAPPAPVSVPDAYIRDARGRMILNGKQEPRIGYSAGWNACRAAMLQGAEPVTTAYKLPFEQWLSQQTGTIDVECGCVMTEVFFHWLRVAYEAGNSPVTPDGWVLVPEEPTHEMLEAGDEQFGTYDVYRRMIAASPQQEA